MKITVPWNMTAVYWCIATRVSRELAAYIFRVVREELLSSRALESLHAT
jgi:hypothetical protein